jgi:hypothetical protein
MAPTERPGAMKQISEIDGVFAPLKQSPSNLKSEKSLPQGGTTFPCKPAIFFLCSYATLTRVQGTRPREVLGQRKSSSVSVKNPAVFPGKPRFFHTLGITTFFFLLSFYTFFHVLYYISLASSGAQSTSSAWSTIVVAVWLLSIISTSCSIPKTSLSLILFR